MLSSRARTLKFGGWFSKEHDDRFWEDVVEAERDEAARRGEWTPEFGPITLVGRIMEDTIALWGKVRELPVLSPKILQLQNEETKQSMASVSRTLREMAVEIDKLWQTEKEREAIVTKNDRKESNMPIDLDQATKLEKDSDALFHLLHRVAVQLEGYNPNIEASPDELKDLYDRIGTLGVNMAVLEVRATRARVAAYTLRDLIKEARGVD